MERAAVTWWCGKGGTGKTTTALGVAAVLARSGRVLVVDLDPQGSASAALRVDARDGLLGALEKGGDLGPLVLPTSWEGVDLVPADPGMDAADAALSRVPGADRALAVALARLRGSWRWLVIDAPPGVTLPARMGLAAADVAVLAIDPRPLSLAVLGDSLAVVEAVRRNLAPRLAVRIAVTRAPRSRAAAACERLIREEHGAAVFRTSVPERAAVPAAQALGVAVTEAEPENAASLALVALARELATMTKAKGRARDGRTG